MGLEIVDPTTLLLVRESQGEMDRLMRTEIAETLRKRYPHDLPAEGLRLRVLTALGVPLDVDFTMLAQGGVMHPRPVSEVIELNRHLREGGEKGWQDTAWGASPSAFLRTSGGARWPGPIRCSPSTTGTSKMGSPRRSVSSRSRSRIFAVVPLCSATLVDAPWDHRP